MSATPTLPDPPAFEAPVEARSRWRSRPRSVMIGIASVVVLVVGVVAGTGGAADPRLLVVDADGAVSLIDAVTGETGYTVAGATPTPDRSTLLTTSTAAGGRS